MCAKEILFSITDFRFETKRGSGPGGQHRNKTESAVRCIHEASGAEGNSQNERSQLTNKRLAFLVCINKPKFKAWLARKIYELKSNMTAEEVVDRLMHPSNIKVEVQASGKWTMENKPE